MKRRLVIHFAYFLALGLAFAGAVALAGSVSVPNTFVGGTPAVADEVNANFSAVETAVNDNDSRITTNAADIANIVSVTIPRMWAQVDVTDFPVVGASPAPVEINRVSIEAPSDGFLVISGSVVLVNLDAPYIYVLVPYVDGFPVPAQVLPPGGPNNHAAGYYTTLPAAPASEFTLSYTLAVPVPAGIHDVWQAAGPIAAPVPMNFFYNKNYLTVVFYPSTHGQVTDAPLNDTFGPV
jgi:hypothetical protein